MADNPSFNVNDEFGILVSIYGDPNDPLTQTRVILREPESRTHVVLRQSSTLIENDRTPLLTFAENAEFAISANSASYAGTASYALNVPNLSIDYNDILNKPTLVSASSQIALLQVSGTQFANNNFVFPQNLYVSGTVTANQLLVSSSLIYSSGSTKFGDSPDDVHQFTGSLTVNGQAQLQNATANAISFKTQQNTFTIMSSSVKTGIYAATEIIDPPMSTTQFSAASIEYNAQRTGAIRSGVLLASWINGDISYTDISNADVGDTTDLSFNFIKVDDNILLRANSLGSGTGDWTVQVLFKMFPNLL